MDPGNDAPSTRQDTLVGVLARFYWMLIGNAAIALAAAPILKPSPTFFNRADLVYWLLVASVAAVRFLDIRYLGGLNSMRQPATMRTYRRYLALLLGVCTVIWGAAHAWARLAD
jgi:hypothetical protein